MLQVSQQTRIRSDEGLTLETSASKFSLRYELSFLNYPVILSNQRGTTVSVEIYPFKHKLGILRRFYLNLISSNMLFFTLIGLYSWRRNTECDLIIESCLSAMMNWKPLVETPFWK